MSKLVVNRPARLPAPVVPEGVKRVSPPPRLAEAGQVNLLQSLLPALAGLGAMIYIVSNPNPLAIIAGGLFATTTLLMGAGIYVTSRSASRRRIVTDRMRYLDYLDEVSAEAAETATAQRQAAWWRHPDPASLWPAAASPLRLWERRPADADALQARVGVGSVPLATPLSLAPLEDPLVERDPVCVAAADALVERRSLVSGIPITIAFDETRVLSLLGARHDLLSLSAAMLGQLVTFTSPRDLRVAVLCDANRLGDWAWVKWLPHAQQTRLMDRTGPARQVTGNRDELVEVLGDELAERRAAAVSGTQVAGPHLVLVVDRSSSGDLGELLWAAPPAATTIV